MTACRHRPARPSSAAQRMRHGPSSAPEPWSRSGESFPPLHPRRCAHAPRGSYSAPCGAEEFPPPLRPGVCRARSTDSRRFDSYRGRHRPKHARGVARAASFFVRTTDRRPLCRLAVRKPAKAPAVDRVCRSGLQRADALPRGYPARRPPGPPSRSDLVSRCEKSGKWCCERGLNSSQPATMD